MHAGSSLLRWVDSSRAPRKEGKHIDWLGVVPFVALHLACLGALRIGVSPQALVAAFGFFVLRMFAITGFYHRYFSHRAFETSRAAQFAFALLGASAAQRGPLWWAAHHRNHHAHSDGVLDAHSPRQHGLAWSHAGWFLSGESFPTKHERIRDFGRYPELRFLDRFDAAVPIALGTLIYLVGGAQMFVWMFCISTVAVHHATFTINSLCHRYGTRRYATRDDSRNNFWLALLTFGEGWHNNHHHYPRAARQGFYWWEVDFTYYGLRLLAALGVIWNLRTVPEDVRAAHGEA